TKKDQEELIHLISNYSKISLYQHHLTKSLFQINSVPEVVSSKNKPKFLEAARFCHNLFY
ncbi:hypothetical protein T640_10915, partial [Enterococcus faecium MRSN 3418]